MITAHLFTLPNMTYSFLTGNTIHEKVSLKVDSPKCNIIIKIARPADFYGKSGSNVLNEMSDY